MSKLSYKVSYYVLYAMFAIILVVLGFFFLGGSAQGAAVIPGVDPDMWQPANTNILLYLMYGLFALAVVATIVAAIFQFGSALKDNPASAIKSLMGLVLLVLVLVVSWIIGSDEPLKLQGYEGGENVPFWLKLTDMFLYSIYFLLGATVVAIIFSSIKKKLS